jgi:hypothetical protein
MAAKQRFDVHPRVVRKAKPKSSVLDDAEAYLTLPEKEFRQRLWNDFAAFVKSHGGYTVSPPDHSPVRCQIPDDSPLLERLAQLPRYPVVKLPGISHRLTLGRFIEVKEALVTLWR